MRYSILPLLFLLPILLAPEMLHAGGGSFYIPSTSFGKAGRTRIIYRNSESYARQVPPVIGSSKDIVAEIDALTSLLSQKNDLLDRQLARESEREELRLIAEQVITGIIRIRQAKSSEGVVANNTPVFNQLCNKCHGESGPGPEFGETLSSFQVARTLEILSGENVPDAMKSVLASLKANQLESLGTEIFLLWDRSPPLTGASP